MKTHEPLPTERAPLQPAPDATAARRSPWQGWLALGVTFVLAALPNALFWSSGETRPKGDGLPQLHVAGDTVVIMDWVTYASDGSNPTFNEFYFEADTVLGKLYVLQSMNCPYGFTVEVQVDSQQWVGPGQIGYPDYSVDRGIELSATGTHAVWVNVWGPEWQTGNLRIIRVSDPTYNIYGPQTFVRPASSSDSQVVTFARADTASGPYMMRVINGSPSGSNRVTAAIVKLNETKILDGSNFATWTPTHYPGVSPTTSNTLKIFNQSAAGTRINVRITATDVTAPGISLASPVGDTIYTAGSLLSFSGTTSDETPGFIRLNSGSFIATPGSFSTSLLTPADGRYPVTIQATNSARLTTTLNRTVIRDSLFPFLETFRPRADTSFVQVADTFTIVGRFIDTTYTRLTVAGDTVANGHREYIGFAHTYRLDPGMNVVTIRATDLLGHRTEIKRKINRKLETDTLISATVPATVPTSAGLVEFKESIEFLYTTGSPYPLQRGVTGASILESRAAVLRGRAITRDDVALRAVRVSVLGHPEYGYTLTREDGWFDLAVNGGDVLTLRFNKAGFLESQRQVRAPANDYTIVDDVALVGKTALSTVVRPADGGVVRSRLATDANGDRGPKLFFKAGTTAQVVRANGSLTSLDSMHVRVTEYTIGGDGLAAMPAALPPSTAYTYCVDLSVDEADELAALDGAPALETRFSKPVAQYLRNFLNAPIGGRIPLGYYDPRAAVWRADSDAVVLKIVGLVADTAQVDVTGDGVADSAAILNPLGFDSEELVQLRRNFAVGDTLWRALNRHFTSTDLNPRQWPQTAPVAVSQGKPKKQSDKVPCPETATGSIIECETCVLGQSIPVVGTPYALNYRSFRAQGYEVARTVRIPLWDSTPPPAALRKIIVRLDVAGKRYEKVDTSPSSSDTAVVVWDGKDVYGRVVGRTVNAEISVGYDYTPAWGLTSGGRNFNNSSGSIIASFPADRDRDRGRISWSRRAITLGTPDASSDGLGGWTISPHHFYDSKGRGTLYRGDGSVVSGDFRPAALQQITSGLTNISGTCFTFSTAKMQPNDLAFGPDGTLYIADELTHSVYRVAAGTNTACRIAGIGTTAGTFEPGKKGTETHITSPNKLALGPDGSVYFTMRATGNNCTRVLRLTPDDSLRSIAGTGSPGYSGDGGLATAAQLALPTAIALGPDGSVFVSDIGSSSLFRRIRRIDTDGIITTYAGGGYGGGATDSTGPATTISIGSADDLAINEEGVLYIGSYESANSSGSIARVAPDGVLATVVAGASSTFKPHGIAFGPDGGLYIASANSLGSGSDASKRLFVLDPDGSLVAISGTTGLPFPAQYAAFAAASETFVDARGVAFDPDGGLYVIRGETGAGAHFPILKYWHVKAGLIGNEVEVPSPDASELYYFTKRGLHLRTRDAMTGAIRHSFNYDSANRLKVVYDVNGDSTIINRDGGGLPTSIVAPFTRTTTLATSGGLLSSIQNPAGEAITLGTRSDGLLETLTDAKSQQHVFTYWGDGRLKKDTDPAGGYQTLDQEIDAEKRTITRTTKLGLETTYKVYDLYDGAMQRRIEDPAGLEKVLSDSTDGRSRAWLPEGVTMVDSVASGAFGGLLAPSLRRSVRSVPSGKTQYVDLTETRDASFALPNPTGTWQRETKVNFRTPFKTSFTIGGSPVTRKLVSITPLGLRDSVLVSVEGRPIFEQVGSLAPVEYAYDSHGRVTRVGQAARAWRYAYDASGRLENVTDTLGRKTEFDYDDADRVTSQTLPDSAVIAFEYDANGNLTGLTPPGKPEHTFEYNGVDQPVLYTPPAIFANPETYYDYDDDHRLVTVWRPDGYTVALSYYSNGRLKEIEIPRGKVEHTYRDANESGAGLVETISSPDNLTLHYDYDGPLLVSERSSGVLADTMSVTYDHDFRPVTHSVNDHQIALRYDYDGLLAGAGIDSLYRRNSLGLIDSTALYGLSATSGQTYNEYGELQKLRYHWSGGPFVQELTRDALGRITTLTETVGSDTARSYDYIYTTAGRLRQVKRGNNVLEHYEYDVNGNRTTSLRWLAAGKDTATATYDGQDRMTRYRSGKYLYNANGELAKRILPNGGGNDTTIYTYDQLGNLTKVRLPISTSTTVTYKVDGRNRRVAKYVNGAFKRGWIWQDGLRVAGELDSTGALAIRYVYGSRSHVPDYLVKGDSTYRVVSDQLGSVRRVVNASSGIVAEAIDYDAWGRVTSQISPGFVSLGFAGGLYDHHTGLVRFGARDYDPSVGRWTSKEPGGFVGDDPNLYSYALGRPNMIKDMAGRRPDNGEPSEYNPVKDALDLADEAKRRGGAAASGYSGDDPLYEAVAHAAATHYISCLLGGVVGRIVATAYGILYEYRHPSFKEFTKSPSGATTDKLKDILNDWEGSDNSKSVEQMIEEGRLWGPDLKRVPPRSVPGE